MKELQLQVQDEDDGNRAWKFVLAHWKTVVKSREHNRKCFKRGEVGEYLCTIFYFICDRLLSELIPHNISISVRYLIDIGHGE